MTRQLINIRINTRTFTEGNDTYVDDREAGSLRNGDGFYFDSGSDVVTAFGGFDNIFLDNPGSLGRSDGNDRATVEGVGNSIYAGGGNDVVTLQRDAPDGFGAAAIDNQFEINAAFRNTVELGAGNDRADGSYFADFIAGGEGNDTIFGYHGADLLSGGGGRNIVYGGAGDDALGEGTGLSALTTGFDRVFAGRGNDVVGLGTDTATDVFTLGTGRDSVVAYGPPPVDPLGAARATDIITDFETGSSGDIVDFSGFFSFGPSGGGLFDRDDFFALAQTSEGTLLLVNDRSISNPPVPGQDLPIDFDAVVLLDGVNAASLTSANFLFGAQFESGGDDGYVPDILDSALVAVTPVFTDYAI